MDRKGVSKGLLLTLVSLKPGSLEAWRLGGWEVRKPESHELKSFI